MRCSLCPGPSTGRPRILPDGPIPAQIMAIGEQPARDEDRHGRPFAGRTGREFDELYLPISGLCRSDIMVYNARPCSTADYSNPEPIDALTCSNIFLGPLLTQVQPLIVIPMGAIACSLFTEVDDLNLQHGKPLPGQWGPWRGILFPMYHPSAGMHSTGYMISLTTDFDALGTLVRDLRMRGMMR